MSDDIDTSNADYGTEESMEGDNLPNDALGLNEGSPVPIDHWDFSKNDFMWANYLHVMWGLNLTFMTVLGGLIYSWYPGMILNNWWWLLQCPQSAWT